MHLKTVFFPTRDANGKRNGSVPVKWGEFVFRAVVDQKTGYRVTMAAIVDPESCRVFFGASACAPGDRLDRPEGAQRALGRARRQAMLIMTNNPGEDGLVGSVEDSVITLTPVKLSTEDRYFLRDMALCFVPHVVLNARRRALKEELKRIGLRKELIDDILTMPRVWKEKKKIQKTPPAGAGFQA